MLSRILILEFTYPVAVTEFHPDVSHRFTMISHLKNVNRTISRGDVIAILNKEYILILEQFSYKIPQFREQFLLIAPSQYLLGREVSLTPTS